MWKDLWYEEEYYLGWFLIKERLREILEKIKEKIKKDKLLFCSCSFL